VHLLLVTQVPKTVVREFLEASEQQPSA
jgi:hypothetical protein